MAGKQLLTFYISLQGLYLFSNAEVLHGTHNYTTLETDPCVFHTTLNDAWRQVNNTEIGNHCDTSLAEGWYRVSLRGNPASIPRVCIKGPACGVPVPLHIQFTTDPDPGDFGEAKSCGSFQIYGKWDCCVFENQIPVKNCGDFYVYRLVPQDNCNVGYCLIGEGDDVEQFTAKTGESVDSDEHVMHGRDFSSLRNPRQTSRDSPDIYNHFINPGDHSRTLEDDNPVTCQDGHLLCDNGKECFLNTTRCDDSFDCVDMSDELNCPAISYCSDGLSMCEDGSCIDPSRRACEPTTSTILTTATSMATTTPTTTTPTTTITTTTTPMTTKTTTKTTTSTTTRTTAMTRNSDNTATSALDTTSTTSRTAFVYTFSIRGNDRTHRTTFRVKHRNHSQSVEQQLSSEHGQFSASPVSKSSETSLQGTITTIMSSVYSITNSSFNETHDHHSRNSSLLYENQTFHVTRITVTPLTDTRFSQISSKNIVSSSISLNSNDSSATELHMSTSMQYHTSRTSLTSDSLHIFDIRSSHGSESVIPSFEDKSSETVDTLTRNILEHTLYETQNSDTFGSITEQFKSYLVNTTPTQEYDTKSLTPEVPLFLSSSLISKKLSNISEHNLKMVSKIEGFTSVNTADIYINRSEAKFESPSNLVTSSFVFNSPLTKTVVQYQSVFSNRLLPSFLSFSSTSLPVSTSLLPSYSTETYQLRLATITSNSKQKLTIATLTETGSLSREIFSLTDSGIFLSSSPTIMEKITQTNNVTATPLINNITMASVTGSIVATMSSNDLIITPFTTYYVTVTSLTNNITITTHERDIFTDNLRLFISVIVVGTVSMLAILIGILFVRHKARAGNWTCQREEYYARCEKDLLMKTKHRTSILPDDDVDNEENHMMENTSFYLSFEEIDTRPASVPDSYDGLVIPIKELEAIETEDTTDNTQF